MKQFKSILFGALCSIASVTAFAQSPSPKLLNPTNHTLVLIDHEGQMGFATTSIPMVELRNNTGLIAKASKVFNVSTIVTTVAEASFSGPVFPEIEAVYPQASTKYYDRTTMNTWEDKPTHDAIVKTGNKKIVLAGLWTSVCIVGPALSALADGYEVYIITDACGDVSHEAHNMAVQRMIQAGAQPMTSLQYMLELQRDWARQATYKPVTDAAIQFGGSYGIGIQYAKGMLKH
ncbi:hydrolase [Emticicia sp. SJ17W-69]|uniref:hydrolase n=1 Tax=Emticicia sp. SJ17W-69 TaxID=3421657 RepID=UPI003EBBF619